MRDLFSTQIVIRGDCLEKMKEMEPCSIDCILTDPPYGLSFMGKDWDRGMPGVEFWKAALRVCKPGAMMLAFGGTRTYHRLACAIEDAGFEIRDCIQYLYGSGFPKSHNFGKKLGGEWEGYGTALKPAHEPIIVAMKPLDGTFANNAEKWGVAGMNIDECRVETNDKLTFGSRELGDGVKYGKCKPTTEGVQHLNGRWPANIILDEEAGHILDQQSGFSKSTKTIKSDGRYQTGNPVNALSIQGGHSPNNSHNDSGGASRFFYCAKASAAERNKGLDKPNPHCTVKPIKLMEYLLKLVMPPFEDAVVLDPFAGSGSTLVAAKNLGFNAIGIELSEEYAEIAERRIA